MAYRRTSIVLAVVLGLFIGAKIVNIVIYPTPARERASAQVIAGEMGTALRSVRSASFSAIKTPSTPAITISIDAHGNFQTIRWDRSNASRPAVTERVVNASVFYRADYASLINWLTLGGPSINPTTIQTFAKRTAGHWFTTGHVATSSENPPTVPKGNSKLFSYLHMGSPKLFATHAATTTDDGVAVIPLDTGSTFWFIPPTGPALPSYLSSFSASPGPLPFETGATIHSSFNDVAPLPSPPTFITAPPSLAFAWNSEWPTPKTSHLSPVGFLNLALSKSKVR